MKEDSNLNKKWERVRRFKGNVALEGYQTDQPRSGVWKGRGELNKGKPFLIIVDLWAYL